MVTILVTIWFLSWSLYVWLFIFLMVHSRIITPSTERYLAMAKKSKKTPKSPSLVDELLKLAPTFMPNIPANATPAQTIAAANAHRHVTAGSSYGLWVDQVVKTVDAEIEKSMLEVRISLSTPPAPQAPTGP